MTHHSTVALPGNPDMSQYNIEIHLAFVDIRKAFDTVDRIKLMDMIRNDGVSNQLITAIFNINTDNYTAI
jgi:hypothetical protein